MLLHGHRFTSVFILSLICNNHICKFKNPKVKRIYDATQYDTVSLHKIESAHGAPKPESFLRNIGTQRSEHACLKQDPIILYQSFLSTSFQYSLSFYCTQQVMKGFLDTLPTSYRIFYQKCNNVVS